MKILTKIKNNNLFRSFIIFSIFRFFYGFFVLFFSYFFTTPSEVKRFFNLKSGIDKDSSKKIIALIRENNKKIQCSYQNQQIRVTGKKRDDLQEVIQLVKESKIEIPLNYGNFRD